VTRRPSRATTIVNGRPRVALIVSAIVSGVTARPSISRIRSSGRRPAVAAGWPGSTRSTSRVACACPSMKTATKSASARRMFTPGPAAMTAIFFHADWRQ
jgi:hypothetical protein